MNRVKSFLQKHFYLKANSRAKEIYLLIKPFINKDTTVLDIGCGSGLISSLLLKNNINTTSIDIRNNSINYIKPIIYKGSYLPFHNDKFDTSLLIFVLHHAKNPSQLLEEANRVSKKILIIEDIYSNKFEKILLQLRDKVLNLDFSKNLSSFKKDQEWRQIFKNMNLTILNTKYRKSFYHPKINIALYFLQKS